MKLKYEPEAMFAIHLRAFKLIGVWPIDTKNSLLRFLYKLYSFAFLTIFTVTYFSIEIFNVMGTRRDLKGIVDSCYLLFTHIANAVKLVNFIVRVNTIKKMMSEAKQPAFAPKRPEHLATIKSTARSIRQDTILLLILVGLAVTAWALCEFLSNERVTETPFITRLPVSLFDNVTFLYVYQVFCILMNGFVNALMDTLASGMLTLMGGQLENLKYDLRALTDDSLVIVKSELSGRNVTIDRDGKLDSADERIPKQGQSPWKVLDSPRTRRRFDRILHVHLVECIKRHRTIVRYVQETKCVFQIGIIVQIISSTIIICLTCFELIVVPMASMFFISMLLYQMCMLFEIFCYCWRGNEITLKTTELVNAAYGCKWLLGSKGFRTSLLIIMCRMQRHLNLLMGGFFFLSVNTFFAILKTAYSFLVLLQKMYSRNI